MHKHQVDCQRKPVYEDKYKPSILSFIILYSSFAMLHNRVYVQYVLLSTWKYVLFLANRLGTS